MDMNKSFSPVKKAVILARGLGTRMRAKSASDSGAKLNQQQNKMADRGIKAMVDVGRPFLDYILNELAEVGVEEVCLVIGPEHDVIREHYGRQKTSRLKISFAIQEQPLGTANAVAAAADFAGQDRFIVLNSDNFYPAEVLRELVSLPGTGMAGFDRASLIEKSNIPAERVNAFAAATVDEDGALVDLIEKPDVVTGNQLVSMNCWLLTPGIFEACRSISPSSRGEYELPDAIRAQIKAGDAVTVTKVYGGVLDLSGRDDIASVKKYLDEYYDVQNRQVTL